MNEEFAEAERRWREAEEDFGDVREERKDKFGRCFNYVAREMNAVFKVGNNYSFVCGGLSG